MPKPTHTRLTEDERRLTRQWLDNWTRVGPLLDEERWARVAALTDQDAVRMALDLWRLAVPGRGDDGEGLLAMKGRGLA
jgi:hypothetical protein